MLRYLLVIGMLETLFLMITLQNLMLNIFLHDIFDYSFIDTFPFSVLILPIRMFCGILIT